MPIYAHSVEGCPESGWEPLDAHLHAVATRAADLAAPLGLGEWARLSGLLHDLGKSGAAFQARLHAQGAGERVDHSTAGAREAVRRWGPMGWLLAYPVAGHHAGLPDSAEVGTRCQRKTLPNYDPTVVDLPDALPALAMTPGDPDVAPSLVIRMLFSCLVDADRRATEAFYDPDTAFRRGGRPDLASLAARLDAHLADMTGRPDADRPINRQRRAIQDACRDAAVREPGLFSLTVPTGGGKTLASLLFALQHAQAHGLRRVIYAIPYTSIIEQTAASFRDILGDDAVLEHHCNHPYPDKDDTEGQDAYAKMKLDAENWDAPVVVTTNVQLFESLFAARPGACRKLHAVAGSVLVLDEAQMLPTAYLKSCIAVLRELAANYRVSPVLCTATQPALEKSDWLPCGFDPEAVREIAPDPDALHDAFRRVTVVDAGTLDDDGLADMLAAREQSLCIVNTRGHAAALYQALRDRTGAADLFHLSARMCPVHRREKLADICAALAKGRPCRVVSTQLVEAGVDVDFPEVVRAIAGLDSIAQAAGRCNREMRAASGTVHVFTPARGRTLPDARRRIDCARDLMDDDADLLSPEAQRDFFRRLYDLEDLDPNGILRLLGAGQGELAFQFRQADAAFRFIDNAMEPVIVPHDAKARSRIDALRHAEAPGRLARSLDPYTVQIHPRELAGLRAAGAVETLHESYTVLINTSLYKPHLGLCPEDPTYLTTDALMA